MKLNAITIPAGPTPRALCAIAIAASLALSHCSTKSTSAVTKPTHGGNASLSDRDILPAEYQREGFISKDLYRIVIVSPADECPDMGYVEKNARQRAFMSLQKHLESRNKIVDQNTRARLLNLINEKGTVKNLECRDEKRKAFVFEIEMKNLGQYLDGLAGRR
ncbi:MAG TPA: hypothetical protein PLG31_10295 [Spirochaetota bacterium]|nr:hypothetical protein [Spirochaetota bacterium]